MGEKMAVTNESTLFAVEAYVRGGGGPETGRKINPLKTLSALIKEIHAFLLK